MKRLSILTFLALFAATLAHQGAAWAQNKDEKAADWSQVLTVTSAWTHITEGSTKGFELKDDYYYVTEDLTFTNTTGGAGQGSGFYVQAGREVRLYIPAGVTVTATGADANGTTGAGAGILLPEGSTLHILGEGKLVATGGNAANGTDGGNGTKGEEDEESVGTWFLGKKILGGLGGGGGNGGGGAGGGEGGVGTESNSGAKGITCWFQGEDDEFAETDNHKPGGKGGAAGSASAAKSAGVADPLSYTVSYYTVASTPSKDEEKYNVGSSTKITLPTLSGVSGKANRWKWILSIYGNVAGSTTGHCAGPNGDVYTPGETVDLSNIYGAIEFCAVYVGCEIDCASKTNYYWTMGYAKFVADKYTVVDLKNRTLYKDGYWNTLTLPFSLSAEKLATTCLAGADIRTFKSASMDRADKRLTINFSEKNEGEIKAGVPCIIRWGEPGNAPGGTIENPSFTNIAVAMLSCSVKRICSIGPPILYMYMHPVVTSHTPNKAVSL